MSAGPTVSRRDVLKAGALAGGGLVLGIVLPAGARAARRAQAAQPFVPNAFLRIAPDDTVTVIANHSEMGQGVYTSLPMVVAEELDADWSTVRVEPAPVDPVYNHTAFGIQIVGGSTTTWSEWDRFRRAGATARAMLVLAAAARWGVEPGACTTDRGRVVHEASGRRASYGSLADAAAAVEAPENVALKDPKDFRLIGRPTKRLDTPAKIDGSAEFGIDVQVPGMLVAVVARPPVFGGSLRRFDDAGALAVPGVRHVVEIDRGVAVIADGWWAALQGRRALEVEWDDGPHAGFDTEQQRRQYAELAGTPGAVAAQAGDAEAALAGAARTIDADYEVPFLAHAPMEPLNCVADVRADSCDVWVGTQSQTLDAMAAAQAAGLRPDQVVLHTPFLGGGFGRRAVLDSHFVVEAVQASKAVGAPVKVIWSREDDVQGGFYRPAALHRLRAALDEGGRPRAWHQRIVCQSFVVGTPFAAMMVHDGVDHAAVEGAAETPYAIPNRRVEWHQAPTVPPTLWWRSVGHSHTAFAVEGFIDELAAAAGRDPLAYRLELIDGGSRLRGVLERAAGAADWGRPLGAGRGRGIAAHASFGSFVAHVAEVTVSPGGGVRVDRVVCAIDCGPVVNPDTVRAQMEGCVAFALSAVLHGAITFANGRVQQRNYHDYRVVRMHEMPVVETHIIDSTDSMGGVGEPGVPPLAPAVLNAVFAATGRRLRRLPVRREDLA